jgi:peptide/nickel transport system substrate-binding protein
LASAILAVAVAAGIAGCAPTAASPEAESISFRVYSIPGTWDPFQGAGIDIPSQAVYESLVEAEGVQFDPDMLVPRLATEWEVAEDGKTVTFTLRDDVDFVDGEHMTAEGIAAYLTKLFESDGYFHKTASDGYGTEVVASGEYELTFTTDVPVQQTWWLIIAETPMISPAAAEDPSVLADGPVGTGAYVVDEVVADVSISFTKRDDYYDPETYPYENVEMRIFEDDIAALNALKSGELDAGSIGGTGLIVEAKNSGLSTFYGAGITTFMFILDREGASVPALADLRVRRAIAHAFDKQAINESINFGLTDPPAQMWPESSPLYVEGGDDAYAYDLDLARDLMSEAGYADGFDLTIPVMSGQLTYQPAITQALSEIGIRVEFVPIADADAVKHILEEWPGGVYPVAFWGTAASVDIGTNVVRDFFRIGDDPDALEMWDRYTNGAPAESNAAIKEIGELMFDQAWFIPIASSPNAYVSSADVAVEIPAAARWPQLRHYQPAQ